MRQVDIGAQLGQALGHVKLPARLAWIAARQATREMCHIDIQKVLERVLHMATLFLYVPLKTRKNTICKDDGHKGLGVHWHARNKRPENLRQSLKTTVFPPKTLPSTKMHYLRLNILHYAALIQIVSNRI